MRREKGLGREQGEIGNNVVTLRIIMIVIISDYVFSSPETWTGTQISPLFPVQRRWLHFVQYHPKGGQGIRQSVSHVIVLND